MGEDIGKLGGVFRVTDALQKDFGERPGHRHPARRERHRRHRGRPGDARLPAGRRDPVRRVRLPGVRPDRQSQVAKLHARSRGEVQMPIVIRIPYGGGIGAVEHHSESPEAYFAHTAGLRVVSPSQPGRRVLDGPAGDRVRRPGDLLRAEAPVLGEGGASTRRPSPDPLFAGAGRPAGQRRSRSPRTGRWCAPAWTPPGCRRGRGLDLEVVDLRSLSPLDLDTLVRLGRAHRPAGRRARGAGVPRPRRRDRGARHRALLLLPRGAGAAGRRVPRALPALARSRSTTCPTSTGCSTPSTGRWRTE